jgi:hypothetical protein
MRPGLSLCFFVMRVILFPLAIVFFIGCTGNENKAHESLSADDHDRILDAVAPYVIKKSDEFSYEQRFDAANKPYYDNFIKVSNASLRFVKESDTATIFFFAYRDHTSLYEHYRGLGGYFKKDDQGNIVFMNLLYHMPRVTGREMDERAELLFEQMVTRGNVDRFLGRREFIQTPNKDFYYNTRINRWDYTENSSWKFLEEARREALGEKKP